ncbi:hypothetical protein HHK36_003000 [Tetracentron sinense]|uniref:Filament-like plant protein 4 n=1 Tax=Tetracentron sinense TaxID=13715 RepID=A0A834ZNG7_TETSI|nr:hypothetical protein HHK36_003000 [Tetracentron sinense]
MDRRSWPWKKKSSDKTVTEKTVSASDSTDASLASAGSEGDQNNYKKVNYVQISMESYGHLTGLEDQFKSLEDQVKELNEKLSSAHSEMTTKDNLVKQHAKVAEEAVSGWEKAEVEATTLKHQLESVTFLKLTAEDRASHLDGALKECMRQIRNVKEEHEQKLHEVVLTKTKQWDKIKLELEAKIVDLDQALLRSSAENAALSRSLQERSNMLMKISEEKSQAEAEIELLKSNMQSCEGEISSLKYELHIVSKELEIRNEEKNMSLRSAEVVNKQHLEGVKKIAKLETECQRLRGLVRKKLPGPAALAQMKLEVENLGHDYGESRPWRSPVKSPSTHLSPLPEFSLDSMQQCHKETDFLTERFLAMEEETKMLKEALTKRNSELQASRNACSKTVSKLRSLEAQMQALNQQRSSPKLNVEILTEGSSSQNASNPPSLTSISEVGTDDEGSCVESCATVLISELSHLKKEKNFDKSNKADNKNHLELMDDFLEMERLACLSIDSNGAISIMDGLNNKRTEIADRNALVDVAKGGSPHPVQQPDLDPSANQDSSNAEFSAVELASDVDQASLLKLRSRISMILESQAKDTDMVKIFEDIKHVVQDIQDNLPQHSVGCTSEETHSVDSTCNRQACPLANGECMGREVSLPQDSKPNTDTKHIIDPELAAAVSQIHDFVISLSNDALVVQDTSPDGHGLSKKIEEFPASVNKVLSNKMSLVDFVLDLSHVLAKVCEVSFNALGYKENGGKTQSPDCIDKITLLENKVVQDDSSRERFPNSCSHISHSTSYSEVLQDGNLCTSFELNATSCKCSLELELLKSEKDNMATDLARCTENLENTKCQLQETEQLLAELKYKLASSQKSNSLAETQLKCMTESYKSLEIHAQELETEINLLRAKSESLDTELRDEKQSHQDALAKCKDLQERMQRNESCSMCSLSSEADVDIRTKQKANQNNCKNELFLSLQEREISAAAEKLAVCQETIFLLGKQLKAMCPPTELAGSPYSERHQTSEGLKEYESSPSGFSLQGGVHSSQDLDQDQDQMDNAASTNVHIVGGESPSDMYNSPSSPSSTEANLLLRSPISSRHPKHLTKSTSSSSSTALTPEKHSRSFSRFFTSKGKSGHY